jgi:hypothetical protein
MVTEKDSSDVKAVKVFFFCIFGTITDTTAVFISDDKVNT